MFPIRDRYGVVVPDHQTRIVVCANKVLSAVVVAVDHPLIHRVFDYEVG